MWYQSTGRTVSWLSPDAAPTETYLLPYWAPPMAPSVNNRLLQHSFCRSNHVTLNLPAANHFAAVLHDHSQSPNNWVCNYYCKNSFRFKFKLMCSVVPYIIFIIINLVCYQTAVVSLPFPLPKSTIYRFNFCSDW